MKVLILRFNQVTNKWENHLKLRNVTKKTIDFYCNLGYVCQHLFNMPNRRSFLNSLNKP